MDQSTAALSATIVIVLLIIAAAYAWYNLMGWHTFEVTQNSAFIAAPLSPRKDVRWLRFRNCTFTSTIGSKTHDPIDVTDVLNGMATAYTDAPAGAAPASLNLVQPINVLSFPIMGWNDESSLQGLSLAGSSATLKGEYRTV